MAERTGKSPRHHIQMVVVGEGFGIMNGEFKTISGAFNPTHGDDYHDDSWEMHPHSTKCVKKVVEWWKKAGYNFLECQNHSVKSLVFWQWLKLYSWHGNCLSLTHKLWSHETRIIRIVMLLFCMTRCVSKSSVTSSYCMDMKTCYSRNTNLKTKCKENFK